jgi:hypothetical protein
MTTITILDPRAAVVPRTSDLAPPAGPLAGLRVGLRRDNFWECWDFVTDEWAELLRRDGAEPVIWRAPVGKGKEAAEGTQDFAEFLGSIDAAIMGLCNCGSCTMWAIHDTLAALDAGLPTLTVAADHFVKLATTLAAKGGHDQLRLTVLPYPLQGQPEADVRRIAVEAYDRMLADLGASR